MPGMDAHKRGADYQGNRIGATIAIYCHLCQTVVSHARPDRANTAAHDHIDRQHPQQEESK